MTVKQFRTLPVGTCIRCGASGRGVIVKREWVETIRRRFDGKIGMTMIEPGLYRFADPGAPVLLMTVRMSDGRELYFTDLRPQVLSELEILHGDDRERVIKGQTSRQMTLFP